MTLRIALPIAPATETHCTSRDALCRFARFSGANFHCDAFGIRIERSGFQHPERLPECLASTLPAEPWTEQRPTEGKWWVALRPEIRRSGDTIHAVTVQHGRVYCEEELCGPVDGHGFDGAKWMRREQPADPFAKEPTP